MAQSTQPQSDEDTRTECIIAAILAAASTGTQTQTSDQMIARYGSVLQQLRASAGGYINPLAGRPASSP
jgi:hypothetical protein